MYSQERASRTSAFGGTGAARGVLYEFLADLDSDEERLIPFASRRRASALFCPEPQIAELVVRILNGFDSDPTLIAVS